MVAFEGNSSANSIPQFRNMRLEDIHQVCAIEKESFATPWTEAAFNNELRNNHFARYIVLENTEELIAYGGMWLIMDEAHVTNIAVRAKYRGQRYGTQLLREMQAMAVFMGARSMTLEVRVSNKIAQRLYENAGFRTSGIRKGYYSDNHEDAYIMWAELVPNEIS